MCVCVCFVCVCTYIIYIETLGKDVNATEIDECLAISQCYYPVAAKKRGSLYYLMELNSLRVVGLICILPFQRCTLCL